MLSLKELQFRAALFRNIRLFFYKNDFIEVDSPILHPVIIPESSIEPLRAGDFFLQSSPELCMKRMVAMGCERIFQICPCFRKEEQGSIHLEEFTMLEWYRKNGDYHDLMDDCEKLLGFLQSALSGFEWMDNFASDLRGSWEKITVRDAFKRWGDISVQESLAQDKFDEIMVESIEPNLGSDKPLFLYDYPVERASLARKRADDPSVAERFELYINGVELANGFSELDDATEQRQRFEKEIDEIQKNSGNKLNMPEKFLDDLENMGQAAGIALGLDRLFMLLLGKDDIRKSIPFSPSDLHNPR